MQFQHLRHLAATMEAYSACLDVDALVAALLAHTRQLFPAEVAFVWLMGDGEQLHLHRVEGILGAVGSRLRLMKMSVSGERSVVRQLRKLGYCGVLAAPLRIPTRMVGMVAVGSQRSRRFDRIDTALFKILVQNAGSHLERLQFPSAFEVGEAQQHDAADDDLESESEGMPLLNMFISGISQDLNHTIATVSSRLELLLNRLHDRATLQLLGAAFRAINEASRLIRQIHDLASSYREHGAVMIDLNQLVCDSLQITQSAWFQEFRRTRVPIDLGADLNPVPAFAGRSSDLRIALLCLLRHAMDTRRPGGQLMVRTWSEGEDEGQTVFLSISDDPDQSFAAEQEEEIALLPGHLHTPESQRVLGVVQALIRNLDGEIMVQRSVGGGTTTTLIFSVRSTAACER
jgi:signal transduction histidine kinase